MDMCWDTLRIAMHSYKVKPALRNRKKMAVIAWLSRLSTWVAADFRLQSFIAIAYLALPDVLFTISNLNQSYL